ncbi:hypothetical protein CR513_49076, partial [Mucuna pruriens]
MNELDNTGIIKKRRSKSIQSNTDVNLREDACEQIARFFYNNAITLEVAKSDDFQKMCNLIAQHGPRFKPPSYDELRGKYLRQQVAETKESMEEHKTYWKKQGALS